MFVQFPPTAPLRYVNTWDVSAIEPSNDGLLLFIRRHKEPYLLTEEEAEPLLRLLEFDFELAMSRVEGVESGAW